MPKVTIDLPEENLALLLEITEAMGITNKNVIIKNDSPAWHSQILRERLEKYKSGKTNATLWDEFEKELDREDEATEV